ncbi:ABC transporter ATP-binding protein [Haladaptatus sp. R4]|uniref:ATP-binding cassette domain-containing protein n=1 Tax=Haladaptatus sp. R4 TaxID=1679489 RepID=UPI00082465BF
MTVTYGTGVTAVDGVNLTLRRNETVAIVGESGSGKSSLALSLLGLLRPPGRVTSGTITLHTDSAGGVDLSDVRGDEIAFVPQEAMNALDPRIALDEQVVEAILTHRDCDRDEAMAMAHEALETVGLDSESYGRYPHELSGGMRQRGVIATALVNDPSVLVVDEATTGLDVVTKLTILELLDELRTERGFSLLMVSHDLSAVSHVADRLAVMRDGEFVETDETTRLQSSPKHPYTGELFDACPRISIASAETSVEDGASDASDGDGYLVYDDVYKRFGDAEVLSGVQLSVGRGESVALIGESGVGKSTLGRMTIGLATPDEGSVRIDGETVRDERARDRRRLGREVHYLFQDPYESIPPNRTVADIVREPLDIHEHVDEGERPSRVRNALEDVGLTPADEYAARYPSQLSGGERQRVALARALVLEPSVLVADEPTSMLDAPLQSDLLTLLYDSVADREITLLHITHNVAQVSSFADRIAVLHGGRIVEEASPDSILRDPRHEGTRTLVEAAIELSGDETANRRQATTLDEP